VAKIKFLNTPGDEQAAHGINGFFNNLMPFGFEVSSKTEITYTNQNGFTMVLGGTGFTETDGKITEGTVTSTTFFNDFGAKLASITKMSVNAAALAKQLESGTTEDAFASKVFTGKDTFTGSDVGDRFVAGKGNDVLNGGDSGKALTGDYFFGDRGNDRITGGGGNDVFAFFTGDGKDVITDFDAKGGSFKQDQIELHGAFDDLAIRKSGKNDTLLDLGDGDSILLLGVKKADFTDADFYFSLF
jgi:hypothetical protein